jgi:hypothetical protein
MSEQESGQKPKRQIYFVHFDAESGVARAMPLANFVESGGLDEDWGMDFNPIVCTSLESAVEECVSVIMSATGRVVHPSSDMN